MTQAQAPTNKEPELAMEARRPRALARSEFSVEEVVHQVQEIQHVMEALMKDGEHYGIIPGTKKPTLFKAGAEKLCLMFRLDPQFESVEKWEGNHLTVKSHCILYHIPTGDRRGSGEGSCSTKESKYALRNGKPNPNLADQYNTILKMANKRSLVAAVLISTAASDIFTQDLEDLPELVNGGGRKLVSQSRSLEPKTFPEKAGNYQGKAQEGPPVAQGSTILDQVDREAREEMAEADRQAEAVYDLERDAQEAIYGKPDVKAAAPLSYPEEAEFSSVGQALQKTPPAQSGGDAGLDNEGLRMKYSGRLGMLVSDICDAEGLQGNDHAREVRGKKLITEFSLYNDKSFDSIRAKVSGAWMRTTYRKMQRFAEVELGITAKE